MKRLGILTYFQDINPGTFLQAHAVNQLLASRLPDWQVELIDCRHSLPAKELAGRLSWTQRFAPSRILTSLERTRLFARCRRKLLSVGRSIDAGSYLSAMSQLSYCRYDALVVGSDTVLQILPEQLQRGEPTAFWLSPALKGTKIIFAGSCGITQSRQLLPPFCKILSASLNAFDLVGLRDDLSWQLASSLGMHNPRRFERVSDPTFLLDVDPLPGRQKLSRRLRGDGPILGIDLSPTMPAYRQIVSHFRRQGFQIASMRHDPLADASFVDVSPIEWAGMISHFSLWITSHFHGTVFGLKNSIQVLAVDYQPTRYAEDGSSKTRSLLQQFGMERTNHVNFQEMGLDSGKLIAAAQRVLSQHDPAALCNKVRLCQAEVEAFLQRACSLLYSADPRESTPLKETVCS